jgi:hypothetical protein
LWEDTKTKKQFQTNYLEIIRKQLLSFDKISIAKPPVVCQGGFLVAKFCYAKLSITTSIRFTPLVSTCGFLPIISISFRATAGTVAAKAKGVPVTDQATD